MPSPSLMPASIRPRGIDAVAHWVTPGRILTYSGAISGTVLLMWAASQMNGPGITDNTSNIIGGDFAAFYTAGRFLLEGRSDQLYDIVAQKAFQDALVAPAITTEIHPYVNPPFAALLYVPFSVPGYLTGLAAWWGMSLAALAAAMGLLRRAYRRRVAWTTPRLVLMALLFFPTIMCFVYGQNSMLTLLLYTLAFVEWRRGRDFRGGVALGLLLYKPQLMIALGVVILVKRRWRAVAGVMTGAAAWAAIGWILMPEAMRRYAALSPALFDFLRGTTTSLGLQIDYPTWGLHSFFGFSVLLLDGWSRGAANVLAVTLTGGAVVALALSWRRCPWRRGSRRWDLMMAASLALGLLISPHLFLYDLTLLLLPMLIACARLKDPASDALLDGGPVLALSAAVCAVSFFGSLLSKVQCDVTEYLGLPRVAVQVSVFAIVGWVWTVVRAANRSGRSAHRAGASPSRAASDSRCPASPATPPV